MTIECIYKCDVCGKSFDTANKCRVHEYKCMYPTLDLSKDISATYSDKRVNGEEFMAIPSLPDEITVYTPDANRVVHSFMYTVWAVRLPDIVPPNDKPITFQRRPHSDLYIIKYGK